jgi:hypothetical protein
VANTNGGGFAACSFVWGGGHSGHLVLWRGYIEFVTPKEKCEIERECTQESPGDPLAQNTGAITRCDGFNGGHVNSFLANPAIPSNAWGVRKLIVAFESPGGSWPQCCGNPAP